MEIHEGKMSPTSKTYKVIACESMARPVYVFSAQSIHRIDIELLQIGLHDQPKQLRNQIQSCIERASSGNYDAILLVYGLCGRAIDGLISGTTPLVIPRAHDCITLYLGSRAAYLQQQNEHPGTYWYSQDYLERSSRYGQSMTLGSGAISDQQEMYDQYVKKYGQENADYLMETMNSWQKKYERAVLLETEFGVTDDVREKVEKQSQINGWKLESLQTDLSLIKNLLAGAWDQNYLVVPARHQIKMQDNGEIFSAEPLHLS
jgi:hypothetical protein